MKIFKIIPIFFLFIAPVYGQNDIKDEVFDLAMNNMDEFVEFYHIQMTPALMKTYTI